MVTKATAPFQQIKTLVRQNVEAATGAPGSHPVRSISPPGSASHA